MQDELISRREAAQLLGISESMVRKYEVQGVLHRVPHPSGRAYYGLHQVQVVQAARGDGAATVQALASPPAEAVQGEVQPLVQVDAQPEVVDEIEALRAQLNSTHQQLRRVRVERDAAVAAARRAAHAAHVARVEAAQLRAAWRAWRIETVIGAVGMQLAGSAWPPPVVMLVLEQVGGWLSQLDDHALADDGVVMAGVGEIVATVGGMPPTWSAATAGPHH